MDFIYNDGGRAEAGFKGSTGDCVVRAIAIAAELPYRQVYDDLNIMSKQEKVRGKKRRSASRTGVHRKTYEEYLKGLGFIWTPTMLIGQGCQVHLREDELPSGRLVCRLSKHLAAVVNGVVHDTSDPSRDGTRCVYGYYKKEKGKETSGMNR